MTSGIISKDQHWLFSPSLKPTLLFIRTADIPVIRYSAQTVTLLHNFSAFLFELDGVYTLYCVENVFTRLQELWCKGRNSGWSS